MKNSMLYAAVSLFTGMLLASIMQPPLLILVICLVLVSSLLFINRHNKKYLTLTLLLTAALFGMLEYTLFNHHGSKLQAFTDKKVTLQCVVIDDPAVRASYTEYKVKTTLLTADNKVFNYSERLFLRVKGDTIYKYGDLLKVEGELRDLGGMRNPGDFDFRKYYKSKGFYKVLESYKAVRLGEKRINLFSRALHGSKEKIRTTIYSALPKDEATMLYGIITGDRTDMDEETKDAYSKAGLSHILSVSGLHVGFLLLLLGYGLKPFKLSFRKESIIEAVVIFYYILLIGMPAPALRAYIMLLVLLLGKMLGREYNLVSSISFAAVIIFVLNPLMVHDPGCIISFACMYCIAFLYEPVYRRLRRLPAALSGSLAVSLAVWIGIAPVLAYYFNYISVISIFLNILMIPISFVITIMGFVGVIVGSFFHYISLYIFSVDYYLIRLMSFLTIKAANLPFSGFYVPRLPVYLYGAWYIPVILIADCFGIEYYKIYRERVLLGAAVAVALALLVYSLPQYNMRITFFDVGQGDSACIITPRKKAILIDGGGMTKTPGYYYDTGGKITVPALLHQGVWSLDTVIASHIHDDHIEGLAKVLETFHVKNMVFPKTEEDGEYTSANYQRLLELCHRKHIKVFYMQEGDYINIEKNVRMDILAPGENLIKGTDSDVNNNSLVGRLVFKELEVLFTGDIQSEGEQRLLGTSQALHSDILKIAHHGSPYSSTPGFLKAVSPEYSIISVGKNNFGHPSPDAMERIRQAGGGLLRTDRNGAITIFSNGRRFVIKTVK